LRLIGTLVERSPRCERPIGEIARDWHDMQFGSRGLAPPWLRQPARNLLSRPGPAKGSHAHCLCSARRRTRRLGSVQHWHPLLTSPRIRRAASLSRSRPVRAVSWREGLIWHQWLSAPFAVLASRVAPSPLALSVLSLASVPPRRSFASERKVGDPRREDVASGTGSGFPGVQTGRGDRSRYFGTLDQKHAALRR
jgi:hypothetical protein